MSEIIIDVFAVHKLDIPQRKNFEGKDSKERMAENE